MDTPALQERGWQRSNFDPPVLPLALKLFTRRMGTDGIVWTDLGCRFFFCRPYLVDRAEIQAQIRSLAFEKTEK